MWSAEQCSVLPPLIVQGTLCARVGEAYHSPFGGCRWGMGREELGEVEERAEIPLAEGLAIWKTGAEVV